MGYEGIKITSFLVFTALIKGGLIIREFMELKAVSLLWRMMMYGWLYVVCLVIVMAYRVVE